VPAFAAAVVFSLAVGLYEGGLRGAGMGLLFCIAGFGTGFGVFWLLWLIGASGGGDVKFMAALGAWLGATATFHLIVASAVLSAAITLGLLALGAMGIGPGRRRGGEGEKANPRESALKRRAVPFGVPVALATCAVLAFHLVVRGETMPLLVSWL
jgi:prepilin peptidase CpaA